jgi:hypothetical protein
MLSSRKQQDDPQIDLSGDGDVGAAPSSLTKVSELRLSEISHVPGKEVSGLQDRVGVHSELDVDRKRREVLLEPNLCGGLTRKNISKTGEAKGANRGQEKAPGMQFGAHGVDAVQTCEGPNVLLHSRALAVNKSETGLPASGGGTAKLFVQTKEIATADEAVLTNRAGSDSDGFVMEENVLPPRGLASAEPARPVSAANHDESCSSPGRIGQQTNVNQFSVADHDIFPLGHAQEDRTGDKSDVGPLKATPQALIGDVEGKAHVHKIAPTADESRPGEHMSAGSISASVPGEFGETRLVAGAHSLSIGSRNGSEVVADSRTRDPFEALEVNTGGMEAKWTHAGPHHAEAGFADPALGWVSVRADLHNGAVHASIIAPSVDSATSLRVEVAGLNAHLAEKQVLVESVAVAEMEGSGMDLSTAMQQGGGTGSGAYEEQGNLRTTSLPTQPQLVGSSGKDIEIDSNAYSRQTWAGTRISVRV